MGVFLFYILNYIASQRFQRDSVIRENKTMSSSAYRWDATSLNWVLRSCRRVTLLDFCDFRSVMRILPRHLRDLIHVSDIAADHRNLNNVSPMGANIAFIEVLKAWPLYGAAFFDVTVRGLMFLGKCASKVIPQWISATTQLKLRKSTLEQLSPLVVLVVSQNKPVAYLFSPFVCSKTTQTPYQSQSGSLSLSLAFTWWNREGR